MARSVAVVVNPVHRVARAAVAAVRGRAADLGLDPPAVLTTSIAEPGGGQAEAALASGATEVVVVGGDGTLRHVAGVLAGTGVPIGVVPTGTGNVLAHTLGVPGAARDAARCALGDRVRPIDAMRVRLDGGEPHLALLLCGLGYDGRVMAGLGEPLKLRLGAAAYFVSAARALAAPRFGVHVSADPGTAREALHDGEALSVMVGNVGRLPPGVTLMPAARPDDGVLDAAIVRPRSLWGWGAIVAQTVAGLHGRRPVVVTPRSARFVVEAEPPQPAQIDGDAVGCVRRLEVGVAPRAVCVRVTS